MYLGFPIYDITLRYKMTKNKIKIIILLFIMFIAANGIVYYATKINADQRIGRALDDNINNLQTHFEIILYNQKIC